MNFGLHNIIYLHFYIWYPYLFCHNYVNNNSGLCHINFRFYIHMYLRIVHVRMHFYGTVAYSSYNSYILFLPHIMAVTTQVSCHSSFKFCTHMDLKTKCPISSCPLDALLLGTCHSRLSKTVNIYIYIY